MGKKLVRAHVVNATPKMEKKELKEREKEKVFHLFIIIDIVL